MLDIGEISAQGNNYHKAAIYCKTHVVKMSERKKNQKDKTECVMAFVNG